MNSQNQKQKDLEERLNKMLLKAEEQKLEAEKELIRSQKNALQAEKRLIQDKEYSAQLEILIEVNDNILKKTSHNLGFFQPLIYPPEMEENQNELMKTVYNIINS